MSGAVASVAFRNPVSFNGLSASHASSTVCTSGFRFNADGTIDERKNASYSYVGDWHKNPSANVGAGFYVRALSTGKVGTWSAAAASDDVDIDISTARLWTVVEADIGFSDFAQATFEIRRITGSTVLDSAVMSADAERF